MENENYLPKAYINMYSTSKLANNRDFKIFLPQILPSISTTPLKNTFGKQIWRLLWQKEKSQQRVIFAYKILLKKYYI